MDHGLFSLIIVLSPMGNSTRFYFLFFLVDNMIQVLFSNKMITMDYIMEMAIALNYFTLMGVIKNVSFYS